jgi:hypothetical protein
VIKLSDISEYDYFSKHPEMGNAFLPTPIFSTHLGSEI